MTSTLSIKEFQKQPVVTQTPGAPTGKTLALLDHLLIVIPARQNDVLWRKLPQGSRLRQLLRKRGKDSVPAASLRLGNKRLTGVTLGVLPAKADAFARLEFMRRLLSTVTGDKPKAVGLWAAGFPDDEQESLHEEMLSAALAAAFVMPEFKAKATPPALRSVRLLGASKRQNLDRCLAEAAGTNFVRWLTAMPANKLDAVNYASLVKEMAAENGWDYKRFSTRDLEKLGAGAFLAVAQGNENDSAGILRLRYRPGRKSANSDLCLIGKGIIFDTGGTNLKPFSSMLDMHTDMGGSAVALATFQAIAALELPIAVDCWLAVTENRTGPKAYKSQDILTAANGKTIQTVHTDAEGRLALADTLVLASREKPGLILDYATLTGSCVVGISDRYSGVFSNRARLHPVLKRAGRKSGERVWPFPIGSEFLEDLKSETADIKQCTASGGGDHILAATFLAEFVEEKIPWVHVDLSACTRKGGLGHVPTEVTGFGVRFTMNLLLDQHLLESDRRH